MTYDVDTPQGGDPLAVGRITGAPIDLYSAVVVNPVRHIGYFDCYIGEMEPHIVQWKRGGYGRKKLGYWKAGKIKQELRWKEEIPNIVKKLLEDEKLNYIYIHAPEKPKEKKKDDKS